MTYQQDAMEMYNILEGAIVNAQLPEKYKRNLISISKEKHKESFSIDPILKDKNNQTSKYIIDQLQDEKQPSLSKGVWPIED